MNRIEIRGVIVSCPGWCFGDAAEEKGIITSEGSFRTALKKCTGALEVYISSFGGEVVAGNEIINALKAYAATPGNEITITLGAICASQASVIAMNFETVRVHTNTVIMFHSSRTFAAGDPVELEQTAKLLRLFNQSAIDALTAKGIAAETAAAWVNGPGETWLSAAEAKQYGIISEIIGEDAAPQMLPDEKRVASLLPGEANAPKRAAACAALKPFSRRTDAVVAVTTQPQNGDSAMSKAAVKSEGTPPPEETQAPETTEDIETLKTQIAEKDATIADLEKQIAEKDTKIAELEAALTAAGDEKKEVEARAVKAEASLNQLTSKTMKPGGGASASASGDPKATWKERLDSCSGNYVVARKKFPDDYKAYMKAAVPKA